MVDNMSRRGFAPLHYRFEDQQPSGDELTEVADGVFWLRLPMMGRLNHINVWLLRDHDSWTVVDTGLNREEVQQIWRSVFDRHLGGKPVSRVIATHLHGDHTGNAGWMCAHWDCELWMSRADFYMCKVMAADGPADVPEDAIRFYRRAGFDEARLNRYRERFGQFGANITPLPAGFHRVEDGQSFAEAGNGARSSDTVTRRNISACIALNSR